MEMIDMSKGKKTVQRSINRSCYGVVPKRAQRVHLHHLVFEFHSAVSPRRGMQLVEIQIRETCALNASEISAAALNPQDCCFTSIERADHFTNKIAAASSTIRLHDRDCNIDSAPFWHYSREFPCLRIRSGFSRESYFFSDC